MKPSTRFSTLTLGGDDFRTGGTGWFRALTTVLRNTR